MGELKTPQFPVDIFWPLKENGDIVAIKVQHKDVKKHSEIDIKTMDTCVKIIGYVFPQFEFMWLARETRKNLPEELDFRIEGRNSEKAAKLYSYFDWLRIPKVTRLFNLNFEDIFWVKDHSYIT
jgi:predicted unusual protein kinase regulating ubiquinone biosynthesis (AarF/ABC1/UbiB family)